MWHGSRIVRFLRDRLNFSFWLPHHLLKFARDNTTTDTVSKLLDHCTDSTRRCVRVRVRFSTPTTNNQCLHVGRRLFTVTVLSLPTVSKIITSTPMTLLYVSYIPLCAHCCTLYTIHRVVPVRISSYYCYFYVLMQRCRRTRTTSSNTSALYETSRVYERLWSSPSGPTLGAHFLPPSLCFRRSLPLL